jgi:4-methyl-5(b-hydroxyethyl)-thiazole monophosphate biosynthesis
MKKVLLMLADGFEEVEALTVVDYLRRSNIICDTCSIVNEKTVKGAHEIVVESDLILDEMSDVHNYDGIILPGGLPGSTNLRDDEGVIGIVKDFNEKGKLVAAICAAPIVLERAGIINGKNVTSYPGLEGDLMGANYCEDLVVQDGNILTARGPAAAVYFSLKIIEYLAGKETAIEISKDILLDMVEEKVER